MKTLLATVAAISALALVAPAHAEPHRFDNNRGYDQTYNARGGPDAFRRGADQRFSRDDLQRLERRIEWGSRSGALNRYEGRRLYAALGDLKSRSRFYWRTEGLSWRERQDLEARFDRLSYEVHRQIRYDDYRGDDYRGDPNRDYDRQGGYRR